MKKESEHKIIGFSISISDIWDLLWDKLVSKV